MNCGFFLQLLALKHFVNNDTVNQWYMVVDLQREKAGNVTLCWNKLFISFKPWRAVVYIMNEKFHILLNCFVILSYYGTSIAMPLARSWES